MAKQLIILCGHSGSGKTTQRELLNAMTGFSPVCTTTTRPPRAGEVNGVDYNFLTVDQFQALATDMVEQNNHRGNLYGTSPVFFDSAVSNGDTGVLVIDPAGVIKVAPYFRQRGWKVLTVFLEVSRESAVERINNEAQSVAEAEKRISLLDTVEQKWATMFNYDSVLSQASIDAVTTEILSEAKAYFS